MYSIPGGMYPGPSCGAVYTACGDLSSHRTPAETAPSARHSDPLAVSLIQGRFVAFSVPIPSDAVRPLFERKPGRLHRARTEASTVELHPSMTSERYDSLETRDPPRCERRSCLQHSADPPAYRNPRSDDCTHSRRCRPRLGDGPRCAGRAACGPQAGADGVAGRLAAARGPDSRHDCGLREYLRLPPGPHLRTRRHGTTIRSAWRERSSRRACAGAIWSTTRSPITSHRPVRCSKEARAGHRMHRVSGWCRSD